MNQRAAAVAVLSALMLAATNGAGLPQTLQGAATPSPPAAAYAMTLGDMMNTLIQPRHDKLGLAGQAQNWPLADYALAEIRQSFAGIAKVQPTFGGMPVGELIDAALGAPLSAVDAAIKAQDPQRFAKAYDQLSQGCNACHMELNHPFVVIKAPKASAFANQDFNPPQ